MNGVRAEINLMEEEFERFTEDTVERPFTEQVQPLQFHEFKRVLKQQISSTIQKRDIEQYLWDYQIGRILDKYPIDLLEYALDIIKTALELDKKEKGEADIDAVIQKIFGAGLVQLRRYNEVRAGRIQYPIER